MKVNRVRKEEPFVRMLAAFFLEIWAVSQTRGQWMNEMVRCGVQQAWIFLSDTRSEESQSVSDCSPLASVQAFSTSQLSPCLFLTVNLNLTGCL